MTYSQMKTLVRQSRRIAKRLKAPGICENCKIIRGTDVHHIDMNPFNNTIENLQRLCPKCHAASHGPIDEKKLGWWMKVLEIPCLTPGQQYEFTPEGLTEEIERIELVIAKRQRTAAANREFEEEVKRERESWKREAQASGAYDLVGKFQEILTRIRAKNGSAPPGILFSVPLRPSSEEE